ncbi:hypothetical protein J4212_02650 [Candidatus Woesearchaeota archaeon]|nr:hypothetical protein [Candidatus Woesearchaeota archaeon]
MSAEEGNRDKRKKHRFHSLMLFSIFILFVAALAAAKGRIPGKVLATGNAIADTGSLSPGITLAGLVFISAYVIVIVVYMKRVHARHSNSDEPQQAKQKKA